MEQGRICLILTQLTRLWVLLSLTVILAGCGNRSSAGRIPLAGTVRLASGERLDGSITFVPAEGRTGPAATTAIVDGKYRFEATNGPTPGEHRGIVKRIVAKRTMLETRGGNQKTDSKSVTAHAARVEWTF